MTLTKAFRALAQRLQEAATTLSQGNIQQRVSAGLKAAYEGSGHYCYVVDVFGDDRSGDVVYYLDGEFLRAPYKMANAEGQAKCTVAVDQATEVAPRTVYDRVAEAEAEESAHDLDLAGEFVDLREGAVGQDGTAYLKLIAPGWGSSGYYAEEMLKRDGPKVFKSGTKNFWNHQTEAEELARPEGDLRDLASVLTEDAHYEADGPAGSGLYAKAKVFQEFRQPVDDLARNIGMSIRASGRAKAGTAPDGRKGTIIEELTRGVSVDYVTQPGAGGAILQLFEAARKRPQNPEPAPAPEPTGDPMTTEQLTALEESIRQIKADNLALRQRVAIAEAGAVVRRILAGLMVHEGIKDRVAETVLSGSIPLTEAGVLDEPKIKALIEHHAKDLAAFIGRVSEGRVVVGMGAPVAEPTAEERTRAQEADREGDQRFVHSMGIATKEAGEILIRGREAFDPNFHAAGPALAKE